MAEQGSVLQSTETINWVTAALEQRGMGLQLMYNTRDSAKILGRSPQTLMIWRKKGKGPAFTIINGNIYYKLHNIVDWLLELPEYRKQN